MRAPCPAQVYDAEGRPVLITMACPHCHQVKPLAAFGLRRMANGQIRNCPWCKGCRARPGMRIELMVADGGCGSET